LNLPWRPGRCAAPHFRRSRASEEAELICCQFGSGLRLAHAEELARRDDVRRWIELEQPTVAGDEQRAVPLGEGDDEVVRPVVVGGEWMPQRWVDRGCADAPDLREEDGQVLAAG